MTIQYIRHAQIDKTKWDARIRDSDFPLPYAMSWYLDASTGMSWDALIGGDYQYVMPLPVTQKIPFFPQVYQPILTQQLGVFGEAVNRELLQLFLHHLPPVFGRTALPLHAQNPDLSETLPHVRQRSNLVLDLSLSYPDIRQGYAHGLQQRLKKAKNNLKIQECDDVDAFVGFCSATLREKLPYNRKDRQQLRSLLLAIKHHKAGRMYRVVDPSDHTCAMGLFLVFGGRVINIMNAVTDPGRKQAALHFLFDNIIRKFQGQAAVFDFEGSEIPGVRAFFESFGSKNEPYTFFEKGILPGWLRVIRSLRRKLPI